MRYLSIFGIVGLVACQSTATLELAWDDLPDVRINRLVVGVEDGDDTIVELDDLTVGEVFPRTISISLDKPSLVGVTGFFNNLEIGNATMSWTEDPLAAGDTRSLSLRSRTGFDLLRVCTSDEDCATNTCGPGGVSASLTFCHLPCASQEDCPGGSACVEKLGMQMCIPTCDSNADCLRLPVSPWAWQCNVDNDGLCGTRLD